MLGSSVLGRGYTGHSGAASPGSGPSSEETRARARVFHGTGDFTWGVGVRLRLLGSPTSLCRDVPGSTSSATRTLWDRDPQTQDGHVQVLARWIGSQCPPHTLTPHDPHTLLTQAQTFIDSELQDTALVLRSYSGSLLRGPSPQSVSDVAVNELPSCLYVHFSKENVYKGGRELRCGFAIISHL